MSKSEIFYNPSEDKEQSIKINLSKFDYDLYKDEDNVVNKIVRVKRFGNPDKGETWKIYQDNKISFVLEGSKLTKKECSFLRTPEGFNFLILQFRAGDTAVSRIKKNMKQYITT